MPDKAIKGREAAFSEEDLQRNQLARRGVPGKEYPSSHNAIRMAPEKDPGHTA